MTNVESMSEGFDISVIIPTYNRRELVRRAIDSVIKQSAGRHEIIVVDDGSTDGTADALLSAYGDRIRLLRQANAGVSSARNAGMREASAPLIALIDSDDLWLPGKSRLQMEWLAAHPEYGMVLCDVRRVEADGRQIDVFRRRDILSEDGWVLRWILRNPALVPASVMFRRAVFHDIGGFDESLRTAEDLDFHLRVAMRWKIGVVEATLVDAMRGHDGLSMETSTYDDYVRVIEKAVASAVAQQLPESVRRRALAEIYARNARGMLLCGRWSDARRLAAKSWDNASNTAERMMVLRLMPLALRRRLRGWKGAAA